MWGVCGKAGKAGRRRAAGRKAHANRITIQLSVVRNQLFDYNEQPRRVSGSGMAGTFCQTRTAPLLFSVAPRSPRVVSLRRKQQNQRRE